MKKKIALLTIILVCLLSCTKIARAAGTFDSATTINPNDEVSGTTTESYEKLYYKVVLPQSGLFTISQTYNY